MKITVEGDDTKLNDLLAYDSTTNTGNMQELGESRKREAERSGIDRRQSNAMTDAPRELRSP